MLLAARIQDALDAKGLKKTELARTLNKQPSEITKWLSGTHNFTTDTLFEIEEVLGITLINLKEERKEQVVFVANIAVEQRVDEPVCFPSPEDYYNNLTNNKNSYSSAFLA